MFVHVNIWICCIIDDINHCKLPSIWKHRFKLVNKKNANIIGWANLTLLNWIQFCVNAPLFLFLLKHSSKSKIKTILFTPFLSLSYMFAFPNAMYLFACACIFSVCAWLVKMTQNRIHGHIITSSNSEHNCTLDTVTLSGRQLRSKSIRLCSEWNWTDWLIYVCQVKGKEMDTKKPQSVREWVGGGESQIYGWSTGPWWGKERIEPDRDKWSVRDKEI